MISTAVWMVNPYQVELRDETIPESAADEVLVRTRLSAISTGTELLFYRGEFPREVPIDSSIASLSGPSSYPLKYGYSTVGEVVSCGSGVDRDWIGRLVFAFQPHMNYFCVPIQTVIPVPEGLDAADAVFLPNMETAVNFLMDGSPGIGERVAVLGQGIVGLLTTALLNFFPLEALVSVDKYPTRRRLSEQCGAMLSIDPEEPRALDTARKALRQGADLVYELTGTPDVLNLAVELAGFCARIVVGSWYGQKPAILNLGGKFHRSRLKIISSQVSSLAPEFTGRWDKARRFEVAWDMIRKIHPGRLISHRMPISQAAQAYELLDREANKTLQVVFEYD